MALIPLVEFTDEQWASVSAAMEEYERTIWLKFCVMWSFISFQMQFDRALSNAFGTAANRTYFDFVEPHGLDDVGY